jgi:sterol 24-C-methyltransferase
MKTTHILRTAVAGGDTQAVVNSYTHRFNVTEPARKRADAAALSEEYYTLATDFYLQGWGKLFHFGVRRKGETLQESLIRYEKHLAKRLQLKASDKCLDIGCGVGGPMINMAKSTGATITGINNCSYQVEKGRQFVYEEALELKCSFMDVNWMKIPLADESFDKAYAIEATCHAADKRDKLFTEINRLLKSGGLFGGYEWVMTGNYRPTDPEHIKIKEMIEIGDGIPTLTYASGVKNALMKAGFEIIECRDMALECDPETPWYLPLKGEGLSLTKMRVSPIGRFVMRNVLRVLEMMRVIPKGSTEVHRILELAANGLVKGGEQNIFTPMYFFLARKR